jgi:conjugal transfer pilus assembly protein TraF
MNMANLKVKASMLSKLLAAILLLNVALFIKQRALAAEQIFTNTNELHSFDSKPAFTAKPKPTYWDLHAKGWHWYEAAKILPYRKSHNTDKYRNKSESKDEDLPNGKTANLELQNFQRQLTEAKSLAIMHPNYASVSAYLKLQHALTNRASIFADIWQQVVWQHPEFSNHLERPISQAGITIAKQQQRYTQEKFLTDMSKDWGLFFFFSSDCPYCHAFAPNLKQVAAQYGFKVIAISMDGKGLADYPKPVKNTGQVKQLKVTAWPAVYLVNPKLKQTMPVAFGLISGDELTNRLVQLLQQFNSAK